MDPTYLLGGILLIIVIAAGMGAALWYLFKRPKI